MCSAAVTVLASGVFVQFVVDGAQGRPARSMWAMAASSVIIAWTYEPLIIPLCGLMGKLRRIGSDAAGGAPLYDPQWAWGAFN